MELGSGAFPETGHTCADCVPSTQSHSPQGRGPAKCQPEATREIGNRRVVHGGLVGTHVAEKQQCP